jgi:hypothetical protein
VAISLGKSSVVRKCRESCEMEKVIGRCVNSCCTFPIKNDSVRASSGRGGLSYLDSGFSSVVMGFVGVVPLGVWSRRLEEKKFVDVVGVLGKWGNLANTDHLWWWLVYPTSHRYACSNFNTINYLLVAYYCST